MQSARRKDCTVPTLRKAWNEAGAVILRSAAAADIGRVSEGQGKIDGKCETVKDR